MKKIFFLMLLGSMSCMNMMAQSTRVIKGAVVDKNGNPLPGAMVESTGGAESTTTDADGTFSLEVPIWLKSATAKYAGMRNKKMKVSNNDMIFHMKKARDGHWFINATVSYITAPKDDGYSYRNDYSSGNYEGSTYKSYSYSESERYRETYHTARVGLMGGFLGNWGFYGKCQLTLGGGKEIPAGTIGLIKRIVKPLYAYLGLGYAPIVYSENHYYSYYSESWQLTNYTSYYDYSLGRTVYKGGTWQRSGSPYSNSYSGNDKDHEDGVMIDVGLICTLGKHFNANIGYSFSGPLWKFGYKNHDLQIGVGYMF